MKQQDHNECPVIVCAADNNYVMALVVMLRSLAVTLRRYPVARVWVLDGGISRRNRRRVLQSLPSGVLNISWVKPSHALLRNMPLSEHLTICTYYRLLIGDILPPEISKALYLDVDMIVLGDIGELWDVPMDGETPLACTNWGVKASMMYGHDLCQDIGLPPELAYFNAGVLMIDCTLWREQKRFEQAVRFVRMFGDRIRFHDQDILNGILAGSWAHLEEKWNYRVDQTWSGDVSQLVAGNVSVGIMHFASSVKPWQYGVNHPASPVFFYWLDQTAWKGWRPRNPLIDWNKVMGTLFNKHWYGGFIRKTPVVGRLWAQVAEWRKSL